MTASARPASRATTSAASRCACSTASSAAPPPRGCSRRSASSAAWPTPCSASRASTATPGRSASTSARAPENLAEVCEVLGGELAADPRASRSTAEELERAKENLKGRDRARARVDRRADEPARLRGARRHAAPRARRGGRARSRRSTPRRSPRSPPSCWPPERLCAAAIGPDEDAFRAAIVAADAGAAREAAVIRVAVAGAAGRMGIAVCAAIVPRRTTWSLSRARRPGARHGARAGARSADCDVLVDFTQPDAALANALACLARRRARRDRDDRLRRRARSRESAGANVFIAPNFAIGAVLMMRFAARGVAAHGGGRDHRAAPRPQARRAERHRRAHRRADGSRRSGRAGAADPLGAPAGARRPPGGDPRRSRSDADDPPRLDLARVVHARACCSRCAESPRCPARRWSASRRCCSRLSRCAARAPGVPRQPGILIEMPDLGTVITAMVTPFDEQLRGRRGRRSSR